MIKLSKWIMSHKVAIVVVFAVLLVLAVVGNFFVDKESDLIAYLADDTDTIVAKSILENEYNIIGDCNVAVSYLSQKQVATLVRALQAEPSISKYATKFVWVGTFDDLSMIDEIDYEATQANAREKFVKTTNVTFTTADGEKITKDVETYIISIYFKTAGGDDETIAALNKIDDVFSKQIAKLQANGDAQGPANASEWYYVGGTAQNARTMLQSSLGDMPKFFIAAVLICFVILLLTTHSYFEPLIFLATLGISILLNMGSNVIAGSHPVGTISSITSSCATILQLAIAMDYSIFLMHTYYEELKLHPQPKDALISALPKTISAISASMLTTVGGFVALFFMDYGIGYDLGFVLAKGVILTLLAVIFLQPILILIFSKAIKKTEHKWKIEPQLKFVSKTITKPALAIIVTVLILGLALPCAYFQLHVPLNYISTTAENPNPTMPETQTLTLNNQAILMVPYESADTIGQHYEFVEKLKKVGYILDEDGNIKYDENGVAQTSDTVNHVIEVFSLTTLLSREDFDTIESLDSKDVIYTQLHASFISNATSKDGNVTKYMLYTINLSNLNEDGDYANMIETDYTYNALKEIKALAVENFGLYDSENANDPYMLALAAKEQYGEDSTQYANALANFKENIMNNSTNYGVYVTGLAQGAYELNQVTPGDFLLVSLLSAAIVFIILLFTFKNFKLSLILLLVIESGIWINLSFLYFGNLLGIASKINFVAYLIVTAIELGATVDYAIMLTSKYMEEKKAGVKSVRAVQNAINRAAPSVTTSAFILIGVCVCVNLITSNIIVAQITQLIATGTTMSYVFVFTLLPAILSLRERVMRRSSIRKGKGDPDEGRLDYNPQFYNEDGTPVEVEYALAEGEIQEAQIVDDDNAKQAEIDSIDVKGVTTDAPEDNQGIVIDNAVDEKPKKTRKSKKK